MKPIDDYTTLCDDSLLLWLNRARDFANRMFNQDSNMARKG